MHLLLRACFFLVLLRQSDGADHSECVDDYQCYYMKKKNAGYELKLFESDTPPLSSENIAIVKMHAFNERHYKIVVESLKDNVKSIEFIETDQTQVNAKTLFSCSKDASNVKIFKIGDEEIDRSTTSSLNLIKCEATYKSKTEIISGESREKNYFLIKTEDSSTTAKKGLDEPFIYCDPKDLTYKSDKMNEANAYKKVLMNVNVASCLEDGTMGVYTHFEYRKDSTSDYIKYDKLRCMQVVVGNFNVRRFAFSRDGEDSKTYDETNTKVDVRCVADAKYFCDFDPLSSPGKQPLKRTQISNRQSNPPIESRLSCPSTHKYFVIKGRPPVVDAKFECRNVNGQLVWSVNNRSLTKDGPEVYCAAELDCYKIPSSQLHGAYLDDKGMPMCHTDGEIEITSKEGREKAVEVTCDRSQGKLKYKSHKEGRWMPWGANDRHVYCVYPDHDTLHAAAVNDVVFRTVLSGGISFLVGSVFAALFLLHYYWKHKKEPSHFRKYKQADREESRRFKRAQDNENEEPSGADKKSNKSSAATKSKSSTAPKEKAPKDTTAKETLKGIFSDENGVVTILEAPKTVKEDIKQAYLDNEKNRFRMDGFPDANQLRYRGDVKGVMEENMKKHAEIIAGHREAIRKTKIGAMAKQALTK